MRDSITARVSGNGSAAATATAAKPSRNASSFIALVIAARVMPSWYAWVNTQVRSSASGGCVRADTSWRMEANQNPHEVQRWQPFER
jgi:hypothetical protein